ncbi:hypothetical protein OESDEN_01181 [Oesophagostomum dentatum]|uniref:Rad21/Rec8-like protein C-terminal eukaryotic domain-containing protein n=1 Tax=Oesophagostomum dentatum TaxID=61180 RepID=A0A0B1TTR3_OESDE|nr:hypothetical protein OESDEN_01181 [Oesophagostomum dentatum]
MGVEAIVLMMLVAALTRTTNEHMYGYAGESVYGDDYEDIGPVPLEPIGAESPTPVVADLQMTLEESPNKYMDELCPLSEKKRRKSEGKPTEEEEAIEGDEDHRWSKRTQNVLNTISQKLRTTNETQITLNDLLTKGATRKTAAQKFYTLLVLKKSQAINVAQHEPYGDIHISAGPNIAQTMVK